MPFPLSTVNTAPKPLFTIPALISFLLILSHGFITATKAENYTCGGDPFGTCAVWKIPTQQMKMRIGIPGDIQFKEFVKVNPRETLEEKKYDGFCIDLFREVLKIFSEKNYTLPYEFVQYNGTYDQLVEGVSNGFHLLVEIDVMEHRDNTERNLHSLLAIVHHSDPNPVAR